MSTKRYEFKGGGSNKFWEPRVDNTKLIVRFGKIGTNGQIHEQEFASTHKAENAMAALVQEKIRKGYVLISDGSITPSTGRKIYGCPEVITNIYVGEHIDDEIAQDFCDWLTDCLHQCMSPEKFKEIWENFENPKEDLEKVHVPNGAKDNALFWLDALTGDICDIPDFYETAFINGADHFIWFDNNSYVDIVALRGNPSARAIEIAVLGELNCKNDDGKWLQKWPKEAGIGAPIICVCNDMVRLRDGRTVDAIDIEE